MPINQVNQEESDVIDLQLYWMILRRRWLVVLLVMASVLGGAIFYTLFQKPVYQAKGKLLFEGDRVSSLTRLGGLAELAQLTGATGAGGSGLENEAEVIRSRPMLEQVVKRLELQDDKGKPLDPDVLLGNLKLQTVRGTNVMEFTYDSKIPDEAAKVVNGLMDEYLLSNIVINNSASSKARQVLAKKLPRVERELAKAETELRQFKESNEIISLETEAESGMKNVSTVDAAINQAQAELAVVYTRSSALQNELQLNKQQAVLVSTLSQIPGVQEVLKEYQKNEQELAVAQTTYTNDNPKVVSLTAKGQVLKKQLQERIYQSVGSVGVLGERSLYMPSLKQGLTEELVKSEIEKLTLSSNINALQNVLSIYKRRLTSLPRLGQQEARLKLRLEIAMTTYKQLQKQLQELEILQGETTGTARVLSSALVPKGPVSPRIPLNIGIGAILGVILGVGTALVLESLDKSVKNIEEINRLLDLPLLGTIPNFETKKRKNKGEWEAEGDLALFDQPYSPISRSFQILQTNLGFVRDRELQVMLVTSSSQGEGKSFVSANLAAALSYLGKRVLIVDGDLRRPCQHRVWKLPNFVGLSEILAGRTQLGASIQEVSSISVLTAGNVPPNALQLLDSESMANFVQKVRNEYDFIIIDTPPLTAVSDALVVSKLVDGVLLVVRPGRVESSAVSAANTLLTQAKVPVLGMVVNGVSEESGYGGYQYSGYYTGDYEDLKDSHQGNSVGLKR
jgi:capsular exopolysaccharide synthesis family protein